MADLANIRQSTVLQVDGLSFAYPQRDLFSNWSARIPAGVTLVTGGEGAGKTTLLCLLAGALPARRGRLELEGIGLTGQPAAYRQQVFWADPRSDAHDQVVVADYLQSVPELHPGFDQHILALLIAGLSLEPHLHKPIYMLSTGSRRKVWLAAAFASGATVTLLDDPFAGLDATSIGFVTELLESAADRNGRALVVADYQAPRDVPLALIIDLGV